MNGDTTQAGLVISKLVRKKSTALGNPRYRVYFTNGFSAPTQDNAQIAYTISNPEFRDVPLTVTFTRAGRIRDAVPERTAS